MSSNPLISQITEQLASARCEQDLDNALAGIAEPHWQEFVASTFAAIGEMEEKEPDRARAMRSLMHSYLARRHAAMRASGGQ
jgi:hypothetical protein